MSAYKTSVRTRGADLFSTSPRIDGNDHNRQPGAHPASHPTDRLSQTSERCAQTWHKRLLQEAFVPYLRRCMGLSSNSDGEGHGCGMDSTGDRIGAGRVPGRRGPALPWVDRLSTRPTKV